METHEIFNSSSFLKDRIKGKGKKEILTSVDLLYFCPLSALQFVLFLKNTLYKLILYFFCSKYNKNLLNLYLKSNNRIIYCIHVYYFSKNESKRVLFMRNISAIFLLSKRAHNGVDHQCCLSVDHTKNKCGWWCVDQHVQHQCGPT